jgi:hypothetical protein
MQANTYDGMRKLVMTTRKKLTDAEKKESRKKIEDMRIKDREPVRGIFRFYEVPGASMSFPFRAYPGDDVEQYALQDGEVYTIPLGVAKHLNKNGWYPTYEYIPGEKFQGAFNHMSGTGMRIAKKTHRFGFQSLEFVDQDDFKRDIVGVETIPHQM